jgi:carboxymethylenebutenolidase
MMSGETVKIRANGSGEFDCYVIAPKSDTPVPAIVLASAIHGVDSDIKEIAGEFAAKGFIAAAPDLFWRSIPGPLDRDDERAAKRSQPRLEKIKAGEQDLKDTLAYLHTMTQFNGKAVVMGFCYGGPYSILGPKRLGFAAGISCHGTQLQDYVQELDGLLEPVCIIWGDRDHVAPAPVLDLFRPLPERMKNVEVHIFPSIQHGFMMHNAREAFDQKTRNFSMSRANAILEGLRRAPAGMRQAS